MPQRLIRLFHRSGSPSKTSRPSPGVKNAELEGSFPRTLGDLRCLRHAVLPIEASQTPPMPTDSVSSARLVPSTLQGSSCQSVGTDDAHKPKNIEQHCSSAVIGFEGSEELIISGETPQELESCDDLQAASTVKEPSPPYEEPLDDPLDGDLVAALAGFLARLPVAEHERTLSYPTEEHLDAEYGGHVQRTYVSIEGLMKHSAHVLGKRCCRDISIMGNGTYNKIFALAFTDGTEVLARVKYEKTEATIAVMESEIATVAFLRKHRPKIPVPEILYWDTNCKTPAGAPFMLMTRLPGFNAANDPVYGHVKRLQSAAAGDPRTTTLLRNVTKLVAELVRPLPVGDEGLPALKIGQLSLAKDDSKYVQGTCNPETPIEIGPVVSTFFDPHESVRRHDAGPYDSIWSFLQALRERSERELYFSTIPTARQNPSRRTDGKYVVSNSAIDDTVADLTNIAAILSPEGRKRVLPLHPKHEELCLWHTDLGLWNILIDPDTLDITGVLDWEGAMILPLVFAAETSFSLNPWPHLTPAPPSPAQTPRMHRRAQGSANVARTPEIDKPDAHINSLNSEFYALVKDVDRARLPEGTQYTEEDINEIELTWMRRRWRSMLAEEDPRFGSKIWEEHKRFLGIWTCLRQHPWFLKRHREWLRGLAEEAMG